MFIRAIAKVIFMISQTLIARRFEIAFSTFAIALISLVYCVAQKLHCVRKMQNFTKKLLTEDVKYDKRIILNKGYYYWFMK